MAVSDYIQKYGVTGKVSVAPAVQQPVTSTARPAVPTSQQLVDRQEKISATKPSPTRSIIQALPERFRGIAEGFSNTVRDLVMGDPRDRAVELEFERRGTKTEKPGLVKLLEEFRPLRVFGTTQSEQVERNAQALEKQGVSSDVASEAAFYETFAQGAKGMPSEKTKLAEEAQRRYDQLPISLEARGTLSAARWWQKFGTGAEIVGLAPIGAIVKVGSKAVIKYTEDITDLMNQFAKKYPNASKISDTLAQDAQTLVREGGRTPEEAISAMEKIAEKVPVQKAAPSASKAGEPVERGFITSAKEVIPEAEKIAGQYIPRSTDKLSMKAANLVKDDIATATKVALEGTDEVAVATASELLKHYAVLAKKTADVATRNALYDQAAEIANTLAPKLTEQGRAIQAASILGRLTPEGQVRFAAKEIQKWNSANPTKKVPELTGEQAGKILDEMDEIGKMPDGDAKAMRFKKLQDEVKALIPSKWWEKALNIWKAGLLTGIKTSGLNVLASASHSGLEILKEIPATGMDILASALLGTERTTTFGVKGTVTGMKEGFSKGWRYLKTGYDSRDIAKKLDYTRVRFKTKAIQTYVDGVFRLLGAEDQPFYYGALKRSLYNQARVAAKNKGMKGSEADAFIKGLVESPTDDMASYAVVDAETAIFINKTGLGTAASSIVKSVPGAGFVIPFARTPSAVAMQVINYSPVGHIAEIVRQIQRGKFDQRAMSQAFGRSIVGSAPIFIGTQLYDNDLIALDFPKTERERESWKAEGRKANSIKVNGKWRTVQTLGPAGPLLLTGGHFKKALEEEGSQTGAIVKAVFGTLKSFTEQTFLKGTNDIMNAITDPERNAEYVASSFISSWVPTIINDVARATDPKERRAESVLQRIQSRIPLLRQELEPQVDILGQERERAGNPLEAMIDPTRPSPDTSTPVTEEMKRLGVSPTMLGDKKGYDALSQEENTQLWKMTGSMINDKMTALLSRESYQNLPDDKKAKVITKIVNIAKVNARVAVVMKQTQDLEGEALKVKLRELKESGLLTTEIFKKWLDLR